MEYSDILNADLVKRICFVEFKDKVIPYTKCRDILGSNIRKPYNLLTRKPEEIAIEEVQNFTIFGDDDHVEQSNKIINKMKYVNERCKELQLSDSEITKINNNLYKETNGFQELKYFDILDKFNFTFEIKDLLNDKIKNKDQVIRGYKNLISKNIKKNTDELNELKKECEDVDDIEDIDNIIEMFTETINEIDEELEDITKFSDLVEIYPPLLRPCKEMDDIDSFLKQNISTENAIKDFISTFDDKEVIKEFIDDINNIEGDITPEIKIGLQILEYRLKELSNET
tara:strand:- start:1430 stop:2284 length:855 start_codon:yes stop_codon:yes gene_type:complete